MKLSQNLIADFMRFFKRNQLFLCILQLTIFIMISDYALNSATAPFEDFLFCILMKILTFIKIIDFLFFIFLYILFMTSTSDRMSTPNIIFTILGTITLCFVIHNFAHFGL
jgi:hypothetical protein